MSPLAPCPPTLELEQFLLGQLEDEQSQLFETHLTNCTGCQQQLTTIAAEDEFVQALRTAASRHQGLEPTIKWGDRPEDLARLLIPQFKKLATVLDDTVSFRSAQGIVETSMLNGGPTLRQTGAGANDVAQRMGRYEVRGVLGQGGMGTVLHAYDPLLKRSVAIKVIQSKLLSEKGMASRFVREAQAAAAVEHDNIVPVYAVEMHEDIPCIVMPLLRGETLKQRLEETTGPLSVSEILRIGREAATGLAAAHAVGLIHCDIKPANLWLEAPTGRVKVLDFGLAIVSGQAESDSDGISGTPGYLAPEQARGLPLDQRTDVFSLGCVLYRMATGVAPFTGERRLRALWTVLGDAPAPAAKLNPQVPLELSNLIERMLAREPNQRPNSANEVWQVLDALENRLVEQKNGVVRRRWLAALFVAALLSGSGVGLWAMMSGPPVEPPVKTTFVGDEPPVAIVLRHEGQEQTLTLGREKTLDLVPGDYSVRPAADQPGRKLVPDHFSVAAAKPQSLRIALVGEIARDVTHSQPVTSVAVLPAAGKTVYSVGLDRTLVAWEPSSTKQSRFANLPHDARCLAVSPNGNYVAVAGGNTRHPTELEIRIWNASDLSPHGEPLAGHTRLVTALAYSPDGAQLASAGADGVFLWNLNSGEALSFEQADPQATTAMVFSADGRQLLTGSHEGQVVVWDVAPRKPLTTYTASNSAVRAVAFLGQRLMAAGDDGTIRIWNDGTLQHEWLGHSQAVLALAVSPDGCLVLSGGADGAIRVWSATSGRTIQILQGNESAVNSLAFMGNGRQAVSGGADGVVRLWQLPFSE